MALWTIVSVKDKGVMYAHHGVMDWLAPVDGCITALWIYITALWIAPLTHALY